MGKGSHGAPSRVLLRMANYYDIDDIIAEEEVRTTISSLPDGCMSVSRNFMFVI